MGERPRQVGLVLDEDECRRAAGLQGRDLVEEVCRSLGIEIRRRLVVALKTGPRREDAGEGQPLLLATGQPDRSASLEPLEPDLGESLGHAPPHLVPRPAPVLEPEGNVILDPLHDKLAVRVLEEEANAPTDPAARRRI